MSDHREEAKELANVVYTYAVKMHESILAGKGATGWQDGKVLRAIEAALERAAKDRDAEWVEALWPGNRDATFGETILAGGPVMAAKVLDEARDIQEGEVRAAEAEGWREGWREALGAAARLMEGPQPSNSTSAYMAAEETFCRMVDHVQGMCECEDRAKGIRALVPPAEESK